MTTWYVARAAGITAFLAFSLAVGLGAASARLGRNPQTRLVVQYLHRSAAVTGLVLLALHVVALVADPYAQVSVRGALVPLAAQYRPGAVALGTIAMYLFVLALVSGLVRGRLATSTAAARWWRPAHASAYAAWPLTALHFLRSGTDAAMPWARLVLFTGTVIVACGAAIRLAGRNPDIAAHRSAFPPTGVRWKTGPGPAVDWRSTAVPPGRPAAR